jgi:hypothetical protein
VGSGLYTLLMNSISGLETICDAGSGEETIVSLVLLV